MLTPLFDRFDSARPSGINELLRDITDVLGARRTGPRGSPGVVGWGLPSMTGLSPKVERDRLKIASIIESAIRQFEPRLENLHVTPIEGEDGFVFKLEGKLITESDDAVTLRVMAPRKGGGLGADVSVIGGNE